MKIKKPSFWDKKEKTFFSMLLYPFSILVNLINFFKGHSKKIKTKIKTICVGNIYIGGTGKTPLAIKINDLLQKENKTVFIKKKYHDQLDEQRLLSLNGKLICEKSRVKALDKAQKEGFEIAILDDGLQDKKIYYDLTIVCFNTELGVGNQMVIPAGPLRENMKNLRNYKAVLLNGVKKNQDLINLIRKNNEEIKIFEGKYIATNLEKIDKQKKYLAFSGIGNSKNFNEILESYNFNVLKKIHYPDHYSFSKQEIEKIKKIASQQNLSLITTEKDYMRLNENQRKNIYFLKIKLVINNEEKFIDFLNS